MVDALVPLVGDGVWLGFFYDGDELSHDFHDLRECHQSRNWNKNTKSEGFVD